MELLQLLTKEAILCEKEPLTPMGNDASMFEYNEIEAMLLKDNVSVEQLSQAFELNRKGQLDGYLFDKNNRKVVAYARVGFRYVSEVIFAFKGWYKYNAKAPILPAIEPPQPISAKESYEICKKVVIDKYEKGQKDYFYLANFLLADFYEFERENIEMDEDERKHLISEAEKWLCAKKSQEFDLGLRVVLTIDKKSARNLAKTYTLVKLIIENYLMDKE